MTDPGAGRRAQETYWNQLVLLTVVAFYVRAYRDRQARWIDSTGLARALDAGKDYLPQARNRRSASEFLVTVDNLIIDARFEWFAIFSGDHEAGEIMNRWRQLAKLLTETEAKHFPDGLPTHPTRKKLAQAEASAYLTGLYAIGTADHG